MGTLFFHASSDASSGFRRRIENPQGQHSRIWVALADQELVGWQGLMEFGVTQITRIALSPTYISPRWHNKKIGYGLLRHAMKCAADSGLDHILGWIRADNKASIKLVLSLGWKLVGPAPRCRDSDPELLYYAYPVPKENLPRIKAMDDPVL